MRVLGLEITRVKAPTGLTGVDTSRGWWPIIHEPFTGAWQRNLEERADTLLASHAVYSCITLIVSDVAKCRLKLVEQNTKTRIWSEVDSSAFSPVLRKPNHYQTRIQFFESWMTSKLMHGNTYVLKGRDGRGVVTELHVLDPTRTKALVTPTGDVYYQISTDRLAGIEEGSLVVPAREIIHDMTTLRHHPLSGIPPMAAAALAATHGLKIQRSSINLFNNDSRPGGMLIGDGRIEEADVERLKTVWEQKYSGDNKGRIAVLGGGLKYVPMAQSAVDTQLIDQLGLSAKMVCTSFNVPAYMAGVGDAPSYNNIEALNQQYYSQCLQKHFESIELLLDEGLGLPDVKDHVYGAEFDLDDLLRMDTATQIKTYSEGVRGALIEPNEGRAKLGYEPRPGGDSLFLQQQNYSLEALAKRDAKDDPFVSAAPAAPDAPAGDKPANDNLASEAAAAVDYLRKEFA